MKTVIEQLFFSSSHFQKINFNNSVLKKYWRIFSCVPDRKMKWEKEGTTTLMRKVLLSPHKLIVHKNVNLIASQLVLCKVDFTVTHSWDAI